MMARDADFRTLGLSSDASWEDIKRAFRRLARVYHPDVAGPSGERRFVEITEAYMALKERASGGFTKPQASQSQRRQRGSAPRTEAARGESIFKKFWKKLFSWEKKSAAEEDDAIPPVRLRFIGSVISRAESDMYGILSKKDEFASKSMADTILRRLRSRHPTVVLLALRKISVYSLRDEIAVAVIDHFKRNAPISETLERVLDVFSNSPRKEDMARVMLSHMPKFSEADAMTLLGRFKRWRLPADFVRPFLSHRSPAVVACALSGWPSGAGAGERSDITGLLRHDDEGILIPLLRILRREKLPPWAGGRLEKLMREHPSPAVRVWASAIVRDQNLG
jgi:hypothetical protein